MQVIRFLFLCLLGLYVSVASAQVEQARGKATVKYSWSLSAEDKRNAKQKAELKAIEAYYAEAGESASENFDDIRKLVLADPDRYILESTVLAEENNKDSKEYSVAVRVSLNVANLRNAVKSQSAVAGTNKASRSPLAFVFVSRQMDSLKSYDDRVYKRVDASAKESYKEKSSRKNYDAEGNVSYSVETGGSRTRKASESTWRLMPSANLNQVFTSVFSKAGYKVNEASMIEPYTKGAFKVATIENDYRSGNDLKPETLSSVVNGMRIANIPYIALGTLDLGLADEDPQTGMMRVSVTVNAKVLNVTEMIPETIASVGPVQYAGVGQSEEEAKNNALKLAANNAARELSSQMTSLRVQ